VEAVVVKKKQTYTDNPISLSSRCQMSTILSFSDTLA
jgi:hypothetical protein